MVSMKRLAAGAALGAMALAIGSAAYAQETTAALHGQVNNNGVAVPNASVTVLHTPSGTRAVTMTGASGAFDARGLRVGGPYTVTVTTPDGGAKTYSDLYLSLGKTTDLAVELGDSAEVEAVVVSAASRANNDQGPKTVLNRDDLNSVVAVTRDPRDFARRDILVAQDLAGSRAGTNGGGISIAGSNPRFNRLAVDGVSAQDNFGLAQGGMSTARGPVTLDAVEQFSVAAVPTDVENGDFVGGALNLVLRSGGNSFHGVGFVNYLNEGMVGRHYSDTRVPQTISQKNYGGFLSGPIIKDKLFFFATYEAKRIERPRTVRVGDNAFNQADLTPELAQYLGPASAPFEQDNWFGKLTFQANDNNLFELSAKIRDETEVTNVGDGPNVPSYGSDKSNDSKRFDLRWQFSNENWLNDLHLTREDDSWSPRPVTFGPGYQITNNLINQADGTAILNIGGGPDFQDKGQKGNGLQNDLTFYGLEGHTIKAGVKYKDVEVSSLQRNPASPQYRVDYYENRDAGRDTLDSFIPYRVQFRSALPGMQAGAVTSKNKQYGIYLQDDWQVTDRFELNLGVRYDYEESPAYQDFVTPPGIAAAMRSWPNVQNTDYDVNDYISTGSNRKADDNNWAPRLGFSYDLTGDQRHVIFGGAGRSFDRNLFDYLALEQLTTSFARYTYNFNTEAHPCAVGTGTCLAWDPAYLDQATLDGLAAANPNLGSEVQLINNNLKTPYSDQFSIGMRNIVELAGVEWNTSAAIAHIRSYDGLLFTLGNRYPDGSFHGCDTGAQWGCAAFDEPIPGYGNLILIDNGIDTKLNQLLLSADKPYSDESPWGVTLAYTFSDAKENRLSSANTGERYLFDLPNLDGQPFLRSVGVPRHRLVATGTVGFAGFIVSSKLTLATPEPLSAVDCRAGDGNCRFASYTPDTTIGYKTFDLAIEKTFDTGSDIKFRVRGDIFNVFNWNNFTDYNTDYNSALLGQRNGVNTEWPPRLFKLSLGLDW